MKAPRILWTVYEVPISVPEGVVVYDGERWRVVVRPLIWDRGRGDWPQHWRETPTMRAPIFRWWALGPVEVQRFRWSRRDSA